MKEVTMYEASNGVRFDTKEDCEHEEDLIASVDQAMSFLPTIPKLGAGQYYQHDVHACDSTHSVMIKIWAREIGIPSRILAREVIGKVYDAYVRHHHCAPLDTAWRRLSCINFITGREFSECFYADDPSYKADCINP